MHYLTASECNVEIYLDSEGKTAGDSIIAKLVQFKLLILSRKTNRHKQKKIQKVNNSTLS